MRKRGSLGLFSSLCLRFTCGTFCERRGSVCSQFLRRFGGNPLSGSGDMGETEKNTIFGAIFVVLGSFDLCGLLGTWEGVLEVMRVSI